MNNSVFLEKAFFLLIFFSIIVPISIYLFLLKTKSISRLSVLTLAVVLIALSGVDVVLLRLLRQMVALTPSLFDDRVFSSEVSFALYLLPIVFAGIGVNLISYILMDHLKDAEKRYEREHHVSGRKTGKA